VVGASPGYATRSRRGSTNTEMVTSLASTQTMCGSGRAANARSATSTRRSCQRRLTLHDVIRSGRLLAGGRIETDYMGQHHTAELLADGQIRFQEGTYGSLSSAGVAVKQAVRGPDIPESIRATDGWSFWRATDTKAGDTVTSRSFANASRLITPPDEA
jgi:hypothetical protein